MIWNCNDCRWQCPEPFRKGRVLVERLPARPSSRELLGSIHRGCYTFKHAWSSGDAGSSTPSVPFHSSRPASCTGFSFWFLLFYRREDPRSVGGRQKKVEEMVATYAGNNSFDFRIDGPSMSLNPKKDLNIIQGSTSKDAATCGVSEDQIKNRRDRIMENLVLTSLQDKCLPNLWKRDGCNCSDLQYVNVDELCPVNGALVGNGGLSLYSPIAWLSVASILTAYLWILRCICFYFSLTNKFDDWGIA